MRQILCGLVWTSLFGCLCLGLAGCGNSHGTVPVKGRVTFDGARPPKPGRVSFGPVTPAANTELKQRPGSAPFDAEGNFTVMSFQPGDGLVPGTYQITVLCVERDPPPVPGGFESVTYVAPDYQGQTLTIEAGSKPVELTIDVPLKKR
jgi:hypothetical protein